MESVGQYRRERNQEMTDPTSIIRQKELLSRRLGPCITGLLEESDVTNIMANPDGTLWVQRQGKGKVRIDMDLTKTTREAIIVTVASLLGGTADAEHTIVEGELPFSNNRFEGILPPTSPEPLFTIRKHLVEDLRLEDYVHAHIISTMQADFLRTAVRRGDAIIISGEVDSGKTTMASTLLAELVSGARDGGLRLALLEDVHELHSPVPGTIRLRSGNGLTLRDLVKATLRLNPTRIIIGEVRGGEALDLLKAWNTGHRGGISTLHANAVADVYDRLALMVAETGLTLPRGVFARAVNLLVHISQNDGTRKVTEIARVVPQGQDFTLEYLFQEEK